MNAKRYFIFVLTTAIGLIVTTWILAWWLEPLYGDLTRIGGYAERDFGGNSPMQEFSPLLASWGNSYRPADVLVIGDSFANARPHQQWQNWLAVRTGWSIHTLDVNRLNVEDLLGSPLYRQHPPRVVIWNVIERDLLSEYGSPNIGCGSDAPHPHIDPLAIIPGIQKPLQVWRPHSLSAINPGFVRTWLSKNLLRRIGLDVSESQDIPLSRSDLFSSRRSDRFLFYRKDLLKGAWYTNDLDRIRCGFKRLATRFEANGKTRFLTALAPDKSSAYRSWLTNPNAVPESRLTQLLANFPVPDAHLDRAIVVGLAKNMQDVYMPDDTHWGSSGQTLTAEAVLALLMAQGLVK